MTAIKRLALGLFAACVCGVSLAQSSNEIRVSGVISGSGAGGGFVRVNFACTGTPNCVGTYTITQRDGRCSNSFTFTDSLTISGVDLSKPGSFQGTISASRDSSSSPNADGTCTYTLNQNPFTVPYSGTWNGSSGTLTVHDTGDNGQVSDIPGTFTAAIPSAPPVFPMTVTQNITPTTATASAQIAPRPQDVGQSASVYVFGHAPASLVKQLVKRVDGPAAASEKFADYCVLVQIDSSGKMAAVSAGQLQAYTTGVLSAQGQSVSILNNVPTPGVSGATFYVGYGATSAAMFTNGLYQAALTVPGSSQCNASLASAPAPDTPGGLTGLWWNSGESGWGIHFTQRRNVIFAAWYTYDATGKPKWYVASSCALPTGNTGTSGTCSGTLYEVNGPVFFGAAFNPGAVNVTTAGSLQVSFASANAATMTYTVGTQTRTVSLARQPIASGATTPAVDYTDLWWNPAESGWGMAIAHQYGVMFLAWYVYDAAGKPVWYVASNCEVSGSLCLGTLYRTTGPPFGPTFSSSQVQVFTAGTVNVVFIDANTGLLTYTVDGVTSSKTIKRQTF